MNIESTKDLALSIGRRIDNLKDLCLQMVANCAELQQVSAIQATKPPIDEKHILDAMKWSSKRAEYLALAAAIEALRPATLKHDFE